MCVQDIFQINNKRLIDWLLFWNFSGEFQKHLENANPLDAWPSGQECTNVYISEHSSFYKTYVRRVSNWGRGGGGHHKHIIMKDNLQHQNSSVWGKSKGKSYVYKSGSAGIIRSTRSCKHLHRFRRSLSLCVTWDYIPLHIQYSYLAAQLSPDFQIMS